MKHQVMFVYSPMHYDELDSEYDNAFEAEMRLKELYHAGFSGSYTKKVRGDVKRGCSVELHASPLITITVNGTPLETGIKFKNKADAVTYLTTNMVMYRGVTYEVRVTQRYEVNSDKILPIHTQHADKAKHFHEVRVDEPANPEDNYCGGY